MRAEGWCVYVHVGKTSSFYWVVLLGVISCRLFCLVCVVNWWCCGIMKKKKRCCFL